MFCDIISVLQGERKFEFSHEFTDAKAEDILHDKDANSLKQKDSKRCVECLEYQVFCR